jgi:hypothetical protein
MSEKSQYPVSSIQDPGPSRSRPVYYLGRDFERDCCDGDEGVVNIEA